MEIDHLAVVCSDLATGVAYVESALGVDLQFGGQHVHYGTHNRLLGLGPGLYLEVIAPDPYVPPPPRPRWFGLDAAPKVPRLGNWIVRSDTMAGLPPDAGTIVPLRRGDLEWELTVPEDGSLCEGGAFPSIIYWASGPHPSARLLDVGVRLTALTVSHPEPDRIRAMLGPRFKDERLRLIAGPEVTLSAKFSTPDGQRTL